MSYTLEIQKLLLKNEKLSHSEDKIAQLKQAIQIADVNKDLDWGYELRLNLISEETNLPYLIDSFPAFAWMLDALESHPERFDEEGCLWLYKWTATAAYSYADTLYEEVEKIFSDMKERVLKNGFSLRGYYSPLIYWEILQGKVENAVHYLELQKKEKRDLISDDEDYELDTQVEMALLRQDFDEAILLSNNFSHKSGNGFFPFATHSYMTYYLHKGKDNRAEEYFKKSITGLTNLDKSIKCVVDCVSCLINYAAHYQTKTAWELFEQYAELEVKSMDSMSFTFSKNVLPLLNQEGKIELNLSHKLPYYREDNLYDIKDLYSHYYNKAKELAQRFDQRNRTDNFKQLLQKEIDITL